MTIELLDPNDTGEIPRPVGETRPRIDVGEITQRIPSKLITAPSFDAIPRRVIDLDETVVYMPETIGLAGPQSPPPLPKPPPTKYDLAAAQPVAPWERVADTAPISLLGSVAGLDGDLHEALPRPATPITFPKPQPKPKYVGRHRRSSWFTPLVEVWATVYARLWGAL